MPVRLMFGPQTARPGETIRVSLTGKGLRGVSSVQFTLGWDPAVLRYVGYAESALPGFSAGNLGTARTADGRLGVSWDDPAGSGATLADGAALLTATFEAIGKKGTVSPLMLANSPTQAELTMDLVPVGFGVQEGQVAVTGGAGTQTGQRGGSFLGAPRYAGGRLEVEVSTEAGVRYVLESSESLTSGEWRAVAEVIGDGMVRALIDVNATNQHTFYRIRVE